MQLIVGVRMNLSDVDFKNPSIYFYAAVVLFAVLFLTVMVSGARDTLGEFEQGRCVELKQTCADCTFNNITQVVSPNSTTLLNQVIMTKTGTEYNRSFCDTDDLGIYRVDGFGDPNNKNTIWTYDFKITPTGKSLSEATAIIYIVLFAIFIFLFVVIVFGIGKLPASNATDDDGTIMKISYLKYFRSVLWFVLWMFIVAMFFISSNLGFAYLEDDLFASFLFAMFQITLGLTLPIVLVWFFWIFTKFYDDKKIRREWQRGFFPAI